MTKYFRDRQLATEMRPTYQQLPTGRRGSAGAAGLLGYANRESVDVQAFHFRLERLARDAELRRRSQRPGDPSARCRARGPAQFLVALGERGHRPWHARGRPGWLPLEPRLVDCEGLAVAQHHGPLDHVLQLAHVPWPVVGLKQFHRLLLDGADALPGLLEIGRASCRERL